MQIRPATAEDLAAVEAVRIATWKVAYRGIVPDALLDGLAVTEERVAWLEERRAEGQVHTLVAVKDDIVVGMASYGPSRDEDLVGLRELYALYVTPSAWDTGAGSALLSECGDIALLWVLEANDRGRAFYERQGFVPDGAAKVLDMGEPVAEVRYVRSRTKPA